MRDLNEKENVYKGKENVKEEEQDTQEKEDFEQIRELIRQRTLARKKKRQKQLMWHAVLCSAVVIILLTASVAIFKTILGNQEAENTENVVTKRIEQAPDFMEEFLTPNEYSRPGIALENINGIVVHYTANPGTTAQQNRSYFEGLAETKETKVSSHFIIGLAGEIIQCIPLDEIAYASNDRNFDTISIECCIDNQEGRFNEATYQSLVELTAWLMGQHDLAIDDVIRHYDVTGKNCPKYFVEHESAWDDFKSDVENHIEEYGVISISEKQK